MSDINTLLQTVAPEIPGPSPEVIDADLARGRAALVRASRRRLFRQVSTGVTAAAAVAVVAVVAISASNGSSTLSPNATTGKPQVALATPPAKTTTGTHNATSKTTVKLVDYTGAQLPGFTVAEVPSGWHLSTSTPYALLITPNGSTNNDPNVFIGKLAVLTSSNDQTGLGAGAAVTVNGQAGRVSKSAGELLLNYNTASGFGVNIQAPLSLDWTQQQIVQFADGIQVTANAIHSNG